MLYFYRNHIPYTYISPPSYSILHESSVWDWHIPFIHCGQGSSPLAITSSQAHVPGVKLFHLLADIKHIVQGGSIQHLYLPDSFASCIAVSLFVITSSYLCFGESLSSGVCPVCRAFKDMPNPKPNKKTETDSKILSVLLI